jgi:uncharacterized protein YqjF (DUF2071 family)
MMGGWRNPEPVTALPPRPVRRSLLVQRWHDLTFLHWAVAPEVVRPFLPVGTEPDTVDGLTYIGLIGFRMVGLGLFNGPGLPYLGTFCETNIRLYSVDAAGRRGVVFLSLDAARLVPVLVAQVALRLPYKWAGMRLDRDGDVLTYTSRRRTRGAPRSTLTVHTGPPIVEPSTVEHFVTARWGLHVRTYGRTLYMPNVHPAWPLHRAELIHLDDELVTATGLPAMHGPPTSVLYSPGVPVTFGAPTFA